VKRVLVTGASGFTGSHLCRHLAAAGFTVRALVRKASSRALLEGIPFEPVEGDLRDPDSLQAACAGADAVYHIAALYREGGTSRREFWEVNVEGTRRLLEAAATAGVGRFIHCSTVGVHGHIEHPPANEEAPLAPGDDYQESKLAGEQLASAFGQQHGLPVVVLRPAGIHGPGDRRFLKLFRWIERGRFILFDGGRALYHLTYIDDLCRGILLCGTHPAAAGRTYILAGPEYTTLAELCRRIAAAVGVAPPTIRLPSAPLWLAGAVCELLCRPLRIDPPLYRRRVDFFRKSRAFSIERARRELGYEPQISLDEGLRRTAAWYREQGLLRGSPGAARLYSPR
jgi:nucleoside-diphosphate-sugar epimerase